MSRALNDLSPRFRKPVFEFLARCTEAGIPLMIVDTMRTPEEQAANLAKGVSWTKNSKHLPQALDGKALAIDVCPYLIWDARGPDKLNWDEKAPEWQIIGKIGESLGFTWGGRWAQKDMGHFEYKAIQPSGIVNGFTA